jgi:hypothetical protein
MNMLKPLDQAEADSSEMVERQNLEDIEREQSRLNMSRLQLIESVRDLKPPESTKAGVYKWMDLVRVQSQALKEANSKYANALHMNYEDSNQRIINKMENALEYLIESGIIDDTNSKEVLEQKLLPIWSKKQKQIEEYIETVEVLILTTFCYLLKSQLECAS